MNTSEQANVDQTAVSSYSRSSRKIGEVSSHLEPSRRTKVPQPHKLYILLLSVVVSCLSVAVPMFTDMANSLQSQNLYIGLMFTQGHLPFTDMFATGGFLYYAVIALAYYLGSTLWLVPIQIVTFYLSGIYFYKLVNYFTNSQRVAVAFSGAFYLLNVALGFGGLYPIQFAMPFVMVSLWFLTKYFADIIKDEAFILYGFAGAAAMLLEPRTLVFWALSFLTIIVFNLKQRHFARGFYQLLCIIFGTILVFYTAGYFILNVQVLSPYITQAIVYQFTNFAVSDGNLILTLLFQLVLALASGLLLGAVSFGKVVKGEDKVAKWLILLVFIVFFAIDLFTQSYQFYNLLAALPFGLVLTAIVLGEQYQRSLTKTSHRRRKASDNAGIFGLYLKRHFYLPILVLVFGVGQPLVHTVLSANANSERGIIATYLAKNATKDDTVYVWDDSSKIGINSKLASSSQFTSPVVNTAKSANEKVLEDELLQNMGSYIVVNKDQKISDSLKNNFSSNYEEVQIGGITGFTVYHKK
ncbi:DUF2079 domain-containing protein [Streptococcus equinus]|uniref:DUF2079 domain-containing protein n=1 Tax=Streptococcus equinus TaxID=1335 RepID=UPI00215A0F0C|nr:DUF2079 domain-containing protein [Streptococcus equinus]UVF02689.1 DUF2079 domain-containing protein [Streptococcus equinus]